MSLLDADIENSYFLNNVQPYYFYNELYKNSNEIVIALGYFSRTAFCIGTDELMTFIEKNDGHIQLLCNDRLFNEDADAIENGYNLRNAKAITLEDLKDLFAENDKDSDWKKFSFKCLSYLIALNRLEIKVFDTDRLVHFKTGYAKDKEGNVVAFTGSVNYTLSALLLNYEQIMTFCSWKNESNIERINEIVDPITDLLREKKATIPMISGEEIAQYIREKYPVSEVDELQTEYQILKKKIVKNGRKVKVVEPDENSGLFFEFPDEIQIRPHQKKALSNWEANHYKSLYAMATGTGKTLTAIFSVNDFNFEHNINGLLIIVPLNDLVDQWAKDIEKYLNCDAFIAKSNSGESFLTTLSHYTIYKQTAVVNNNIFKPLVIITTYATYILHHKEILNSLDLHNTIIIADECHNFGAKTARTLLPEEIQYRIGLSATPKREYDDIGTQKIFDYFCPNEKAFEFTIEDAIKNDMLCHYIYKPIIVRLTDIEMDEYDLWTEKIRRLLQVKQSRKEDEKVSDDLNTLLKNRHRIIERAEGKETCFFELFDFLLKEKRKINNTIIFCPEGKIDNEDVLRKYQLKVNQIGRTNNIVFSLKGYVEGVGKEVLKDFAKGKIDILFAKQRLNEGIDIPSVCRAFFISSSTSEREFIQRRGRVLRKSPGKKIAEIYDFIVLPPINSKDTSIKKSESKRVMEFALAADNFSELKDIITQLG